MSKNAVFIIESGRALVEAPADVVEAEKPVIRNSRTTVKESLIVAADIAGIPAPIITPGVKVDVPAPTFDMAAHLQRQREWSARTFGPDPRVNGVVSHIRKELKEVLDAPNDLEEWIDVAILALDGAWRAGYSPEQIIEALVAKQTKNEGRTWPDWRTAAPDSAIEHVEQDEQAKQSEPVGYVIQRPAKPLVRFTKANSAETRAMAFARTGQRAQVFALHLVGTAVPGSEWRKA